MATTYAFDDYTPKAKAKSRGYWYWWNNNYSRAKLGFATPEQCQHVINLAKSKLEPSKLALRKGEVEKPQDVRTSMGTFLRASQDGAGILNAIEEKIAKATKLPRSHYEDFNVLRYKLGQKYDAHLDAFPPEQYGPQKSQRVATFLVYLSDVEEGGETAFPYEVRIIAS
ncbi:Prolyl 4-hydroxylase, alpha subunit [Corchorus olitorius]|uniref:Prolyl 4-hydroxylase, alpha subunit n=1 Tax=Corchorus olitorius TaxID=93759 RepID=A0A1R3K425_9ROSI|nr:Prolyl 4-hydroxylase, alpha subunit [Corchorus olitorius]